jgi:REP element-mobilizing transposase RayT
VARGEFIFDDHDEAIEFIGHLRTVRDLDRWTVFAWCLMGNHYHLVLKTDDISLWRSMARLQGSFSRNFNRRHRILGRLWQSRYRARVIDTEEYFRQVVAYVHLNPVAAGLVDDPANHLYSGHRELIGSCQPHVVDRQSTFRSFGTTGTLSPAEDYLLWIREVAEARWASQDVSNLPWWKPARNDEEIASLDRHPNATTFDGRSLREDRAELELEEFVRRLAPASGNSLEDLSSRRRGGELTLGRIEFATLAVGRYGLRVSDVATLLRKHPNSVTKWLNRGLRLERDHPAFKRRLDQLDAAISRLPP